MPEPPATPPAVLPYASTQPARAEIDASSGMLVLDFGTNWCGHCGRAAPWVALALAGQPGLTHLKVEDGSGRSLGRSFGVKLWPTLVFLRDGRECARLVRPTGLAEIQAALDAAARPAGPGAP